MKHKARQIAVRTFLSNVNNMEDEAYEFMEDCPRPDETYADDYFEDKPYRIWQPFELYSVGKVIEMIDDLANDIVHTFTDKPEQESSDDYDYDHEEDFDLEPEDTEALECPNCGSLDYNHTANDEFTCNDCGTVFNQ